MTSDSLSCKEPILSLVLAVQSVGVVGEPTTHEQLLLVGELLTHGLHVGGERSSEAVASELAKNMKMSGSAVDGFNGQIKKTSQGAVGNRLAVKINEPGGFRSLM